MRYRAPRFPICMILVSAVALSGCATTWVLSKKLRGRPPLEENKKEQEVPLPGTTETLTVTFHLLRPVQRTSSSSSSTAQSGFDSTLRSPNEPYFQCQISQHGRARVYRAATQYGGRWKTTTALMFVGEGLIAALLLSTLDNEDATGEDLATALLLGSWMAVDAVGTGILFFAPRRDIYENDERKSTVEVRSDCPDGLVLEIDGRTVPVNALGRIGELGQALLERYLLRSSEALGLRVGGHSRELYIDQDRRCRWARSWQHKSADELCRDIEGGQTGTSSDPEALEVVIEVPVGTFTRPPPRPTPTEQPAAKRDEPAATDASP